MDKNISKLMNLIDEMNDDQVKELLDYAGFIIEDDKKGKLPKEATNPENGVPEDVDADEMTVSELERFFEKFKKINPVAQNNIICTLTRCYETAGSAGETFRETLINEYEREHG